MAQVGTAAGGPRGPGRSDLEERGVHVNILKGSHKEPWDLGGRGSSLGSAIDFISLPL